jgi:hypothetical protein
MRFLILVGTGGLCAWCITLAMEGSTVGVVCAGVNFGSFVGTAISMARGS